jgi:hypothetical protein
MIVMQRFTRFFAVAGIVATTVSCGSVVRTGRGSSFLVLDSLGSTSGIISDISDTAVGETAVAQIRNIMKDVGAATPVTPSPLNDVTLTQYRVEYSRADGRNTPGVDVPYPFDGVLIVTVPANASSTPVAFSLVRVQAKSDPPLVLFPKSFNGSITTITQFAKVTFFGNDQTGRQVSVSGSTQIDFQRISNP